MISKSLNQLTPRGKKATCIATNDVVSFWKMRSQITGGRWYSIFRAAPKTTNSQGDFVVKFINPHLDPDGTKIAIDRLCREAITTDRIKHSTVIPLMDAELDKSPFFLVQPWVDGLTHDQMMARESEIPFNRLLWTFRQTAEGIRVAHDNSRVYLGLHPSHILSDRVGRATLIGWSHSHGTDQTIRYANDDLGIAAFRAPETFFETYRANKQSDTYSLGVLIYQTLSGKTVATGSTLESIKDSHFIDEVAPLASLQPHCPDELSILVSAMLEKHPGDRPSLVQAIEQITSIEIEHLDDATPILM